MSEQRVRLLLGGAALTPLIDRIERRIRHGRALTGAVVLAGLGPAQQAAIAALLGRPVGTGTATSVRLEDVDRVVRDSGTAPGLADAVTMLRGPIAVVPEEAAREKAMWDAVLAPLDAFIVRRPEFARLPALLRRTGAVKTGHRTPDEAGRLVADLMTVLDAVPTSGDTLPAFSARVLHSAHALDVGSLRALVEVALGELTGQDEGEEDADRGERYVARWAAAGIAFDSLASSVLVHNLPFDRELPLGAALDALTATGQPALVTLRMLLAGARPVATEVFVCENPAVLIAAADRYSDTSAPLVCVRGQPSFAARRLLRRLADSGTVLRYHGDFDWGGIRIANGLVDRYGVLPWRFATDDLLGADLPGDDLAGQRVDAVWDPRLADVVAARGTRLEEEQVLASLLAGSGPLTRALLFCMHGEHDDPQRAR